MSMNRREFIQHSVSGILAASVYSHLASANTAPNDRIQLGCIGLGGMGQGDLSDFLAHPDVDVVALCDIDQGHLNSAVSQVKEKTGKDPETFHDFRDLFEKDSIDAVLIATPDHWHGLMTTLACQAGKDVYVEKPLVQNLAEGRMLVNAARKNHRVTQMGTQVHQTANYAQAAEIVRSGILGPISRVQVWITGNDTPDGIGKAEDTQPPEGLDYNFWLGPAPKRPYNPKRCHFTWRYFWDYGGGKLADFACHLIDLVYWGMNPAFPHRVTSMGQRYLLQDHAETPDNQTVIWEYPAPPGQSTPFQMVWTHSDTNSFGMDQHSKGVKFLGSEGTLVANYTSFQLYDRKGNLTRDNKAEGNTVGVAGVAHKREFLDCIRTRQTCSCDVEYGHRLTSLAMIANIANRLNRSLAWDGDKERFPQDGEATRMLQRIYRKGWDPIALGVSKR